MIKLRLFRTRLFLTGRLAWVFLSAAAGQAALAPFRLPTANHALLEPGKEAQFFAPTPGKSWQSGTFGCVRSEGWQMHEGLDIRCLRRDRFGEPTDPVCATAAGTVAYINSKPALSNYGNYVVVRHHIEGIEIYSLYAHLRSIEPGLRPGTSVQAGQQIGVMGRTANTRQRIAKYRAHVHFELDLFLNDRFPRWFRRHYPHERNDHGIWNGFNLAGLDPRAIFLLEQKGGTHFSLLRFIREQTALCRVQVQQTNFPWIHRYRSLVHRNPRVTTRVAGYEIELNFNGVPFKLMPLAPSEMKGKAKVTLLSVNEPEYHRHPCRRLVTKRGGRWRLTNKGMALIELITD